LQEKKNVRSFLQLNGLTVGHRLFEIHEGFDAETLRLLLDGRQSMSVELDTQLIRAEVAVFDRLEQRCWITPAWVNGAGMKKAKRQAGGRIQINLEILRIETVHHRLGRKAVFPGIKLGPYVRYRDDAGGALDQNAFKALIDPGPPSRRHRVGIINPAVAKFGDPGDIEPKGRDRRADKG